MTPKHGPLASVKLGLARFWGNRPRIYSGRLWALIIALDFLPQSWGEEILAHLFAAVAIVKRSRRRLALTWASHQPGNRRWPLALAVCGFRGRWVARASLLGVRSPGDLRRQVIVHGEEHLVPAAGGTILIGFHLGPPNADVTLRAMGHRLAWLGSRRMARAWSREPWQSFLDPREDLSPPETERFWPGYLYRARRILLEGGTLFIMADSWSGRELFRVPLPGGPAIISSGWLTLRRQTGARVLPVVTHLTGRTQVITIHPPLPRGADDTEELARWQEILSSLMKDYVRWFPEQCPTLVFPPNVLRRSRPDALRARQRAVKKVREQSIMMAPSLARLPPFVHDSDRAAVDPPRTGDARMSDTPTFGRYAEIPVDRMTPEQRDGYRFLVDGPRGRLPGPYKVWVHNPKLVHAAAPLGQHFTPGQSSLSEREREIAVVVITSTWHSAYPNAAHEKRGKEVGLPTAMVEAIIAGLPASFPDPREQVVYEVAMALAGGRLVSQGLHDRAVKVLGHESVTDMIVLMGYYTAVSLTMNFYAVPAGSPGLAR